MLKRFLKINILLIISFIFINHVFALPIITNNVPKIDEKKEASLTIEFIDVDNNPLPNATFKVYKVASVKGTGEFTTSFKFNKSNISYDHEKTEEWDEELENLLDYIKEENFSYDFLLTTDENGIATKSNIEKGLYLISSEPYVVGAKTYTPQSFLISVPNMTVQDEWEYDVKIFPKYAYDVDMTKIVDKKVIKVWNDKGKEKYRPKSITVQLFKDDELYEEVILNADNNWEHTWNDLDDTYKWEVKEVNISDDYYANIKYDNQVFTITNTYNFKLPDTGLLWWPVPILLGAGLILIAVGIIIRRKKDNNEK